MCYIISKEFLNYRCEFKSSDVILKMVFKWQIAKFKVIFAFFKNVLIVWFNSYIQSYLGFMLWLQTVKKNFAI